MRLENLHALLSGEGQDLLARAAREYDGSDPLALGTRLRRRHASGLVAAALSQLELRRKAMAKFGDDAARMYFTPEALEQATPRMVADHRARRFATSARTRLVDLGCGIGSDLVAAARAGLDVTGVEHDPVRAELARANLAALGLPGQVRVGSAEDTDLSEFDLVFADPARRDQRGRLFDPAAYSPPWSFVEGLLTERTTCVKISPAIPHRRIPLGVEAEWVSDRGEVKEAALWSGSLATTERRATLLPGGATLAATGVGARTAPVGAVLYEPDGAVIRAGLVGELAEELGACLLDPRIAYLTAEQAVETSFARRFAVVEQLPYRERPLRAALRARDVGTLTIKKRGVDISPEALRGRLALRGSRAATVVLTRAGGAATALLVEPA